MCKSASFINNTHKVSFLAILIGRCHVTISQCREFCEYLHLQEDALNKYAADMYSTEFLSVFRDVKKKVEASFDVKGKFINNDDQGKM
jgi:hypothetical protein